LQKSFATDVNDILLESNSSKKEVIMTVLIGITQTPEEAVKHLRTEFTGLGIEAIVGPFRSSDDASCWMKFMMNRTEDSETISVSSDGSGNDYWYGFTCDLIDSLAEISEPAH
jgi:hypothetical protein